MDIYVSYTCLKITSVFHITLKEFILVINVLSIERIEKWVRFVIQSQLPNFQFDGINVKKSKLFQYYITKHTYIIVLQTAGQFFFFPLILN